MVPVGVNRYNVLEEFIGEGKTTVAAWGGVG